MRMELPPGAVDNSAESRVYCLRLGATLMTEDKLGTATEVKSAKQLKKEILKAFADVQYPGDRLDLLTDSPCQAAGERLAKLLAGKRWRDWADRTTELFSRDGAGHDIRRLSPPAYRYYLPLFLLASLAQPGVKGDFVDGLVRSLENPKDQAGQQWFRQAVARLYPRQLRTAQDVLLHLGRKRDADAPAESVFTAQARSALGELLSRAERLKKEVVDAFADVPYPGDDHLGNSSWEFENDAIDRMFGEVRWGDWIDDPGEAISGWGTLGLGQLTFMRSSTFAYYLPLLLLIMAFDEKDEVGVMGFLPFELESDERCAKRAANLTVAQLEAVLHTFEFARPHCEPSHLHEYLEQWDNVIASVKRAVAAKTRALGSKES